MVSVCVSVVPTTVPLGAPDRLPMVIDPSCWVILDAAILASANVPDVTSSAAILIVFDNVLIVLLVSVCAWFSNTNVSLLVNRGNVTVLSDVSSDTSKTYWWSADVSFICGVIKIGDVSVLLVNVSVVDLPINVSVETGSVIVPVLDIVLIIGEVRVLFVIVCVPVVVIMVESMACM